MVKAVRTENGTTQKTAVRYVCSCCGKSYATQPANFYASNSYMYQANNGFLTVCMKCVNEMLSAYVDKYNDTYLAIKRMCQKFDYYYDANAINEISTSKDISSNFGSYLGRINRYKNGLATYDDTIDEEKETVRANIVQAIDEGKSADAIDQQMLIKWGGGYKPEQYYMLEEKYMRWVTKYDISDYAQEELVKMLCATDLELTKARLNEADARTITTLQESYQKLLSSANLKPSNNISQQIDDTVTIGTMIEKFERERPVGEPLPEYQDPDGLHSLLKITVGGLGDMLNIKNPFVNLFKEYVDKFTAHPQVEDSDEDDFDLDSLIENQNSSFSDKDETEEYDGVEIDG